MTARAHEDDAVLRWEDPAWRAGALAWVDEQVVGLGRRIVGKVEQPHVRPWSTAMRVPTDGGPLWFKADGAVPSYEVRLLAALARWEVPHLLAPLAVDTERAWMLLPDGGTTLRQVLATDRDVAHWEPVLPAYAELQRATAEHAGAMLALGVPDLRPTLLPALVVGLLEDDNAMRRGRPGGLTSEQDLALRRLLPEFAAWCAELDDFGFPATVDHGDLHDGNVFVEGTDGPLFFDWGDAGVSHPLTSLLVVLRSFGDGFGLSAGDPKLRRLRSGYLEVWGEGRSSAQLERAVELAVRVAVPARALSWQRALNGLTESQVGDLTGAGHGWLLELLEPPVL